MSGGVSEVEVVLGEEGCPPQKSLDGWRQFSHCQAGGLPAPPPLRAAPPAAPRRHPVSPVSPAAAPRRLANTRRRLATH